MRRAGRAARMGDEKCTQNLKVIDHAEDLGIDAGMILEWIIGKWGGKVWARFIWLSIGTNGGLL